jgi:hypothetical protein
MFSRAAKAGLVPGLIVSLVLGAAMLVPTNQGPIHLVCGGYGYAGPCAVPDVTGVTPGAGPIFGGSTVTITGTDFNNVFPPTAKPVVMFDSTQATVVSFTDTTIIAISPAHAAGVVNVTVTTAAGTSVVDAGDQFRYVSASYCALINLSRAPTSWTKGVAQKFYVFVFNCGTKTWPATGYTRVDLNVHFTTRLGSGLNTRQYWLTQSYRDLARNVAPNASYAFTITLNPTFRGSVWLEAEMIKKHQLWFGRYLYRPAQFVYVAVTVH